MNCKPKHKTLRAANGFGLDQLVNPYGVNYTGMGMQMAQNNAATQFANTAHPWAVEDRNNAQQTVKFGQGLQTQQLGLQTGQQNFNQGLQRDQFGLQAKAQTFNQGLQRDQFGLQRDQFGLQAKAQDFNQGLTSRQFDASRSDNLFNQGLQRDQFGLQAKAQTFNQGLQRDQFDASRQDQALNNSYRARREQRQVMDFNRAQNAMSQPRPAMNPYRLRNGGEIHAMQGFNYAVPDDPERVPGWIDSFNAKGQGQYVGRDKAKANEYAVAKRNAETTDRMAHDVRNPYKYVQQLENMYDDSGYNPYTGVYDAGKKGAGAQWLAGSKYRLRNGGDLQTGMGGDVPGTGKGDKIPAKYEPGEFVVSNDMLDAQPGLRDHLRTLREQVLADKGMTVVEADAKAVGKGRGLRASEGADGEALKQRRMRDFNLTAADYGAIEGGLQAKEQRRENIRNALSKNDGFAKIAALNQQAANADARVQADAARGVYRDVDPVASPELTQKIDDGRRSDLRGYVDAQSMRDPGGALPAVPKSLRDTGNIYKTIDALGRTTYSGGNVKEGAKFIGNDGNEFTPRGSVEYAKPGEAVGMFLGGGGAVFTPASTDPTQRATDITTAKVNATAFRDQRAAQDAEEARAYHEAGMAGNREIAKNQALRDIDARVKEAQNVLSMRSLADNDPRKLAALKVVDDAGAMRLGVEKSYAEGEASRVRDATTANTTLRAHAMDNETTLRAADINSQRTLAAARLPYEIKQREAAMITDALNRTKGNPDAAVDLLMRSGAVMAAKTLSEQAAADETRKAAEAEHMTKLFKGKVIDAETGNEIPNGAEMAANRLLELTGGEIVDAPTLAKKQHEAILDTRLTYAQQKATRGRNSSIRASIAGDEPMPTGPNPSATPEQLGWFDGLTTGGGISRNDFAYGRGRYIPAASGDDVIKRAQDLSRKNAGLRVQ